MTFDNAAWAINGAILSSSLARRAQYAAVEGYEGVAQDGDFKVTQLDVPGVGIQIAPGAAVVLNGYQTVPNEAYTVSNPGIHTITSAEMPGANASAKSYLVAVVIGDPDFSQAGHPWMGADDPADGTENTFQYVRPTIIEVAAGTTSAPAGYPALPLARIDVPANTTTITNSMIVDLRGPIRPRPERLVGAGVAGFTIAASAVSAVTGAVAVAARSYRRVVTVNFGCVATAMTATSATYILRQNGSDVRHVRVNDPNISATGSFSTVLEAGVAATFQLFGQSTGGTTTVASADGRYTFCEVNVLPA